MYGIYPHFAQWPPGRLSVALFIQRLHQPSYETKDSVVRTLGISVCEFIESRPIGCQHFQSQLIIRRLAVATCHSFELTFSHPPKKGAAMGLGNAGLDTQGTFSARRRAAGLKSAGSLAIDVQPASKPLLAALSALFWSAHTF